jgi:serine/threonine protein phosphatase 1
LHDPSWNPDPVAERPKDSRPKDSRPDDCGPDGSLASPASLPEGLRVYAVGDIHGCAEKLDALHALMAEDAASAAEPRKVIVYLGDYVDRGPDSRGVLERLARPPPFTAETVRLMGNHEAMLLAALDDPGDARAAALWLMNGGGAALASWGADPEAPQEAWASALPAAHLALLRGLARSARFGGYFFAHAGVRPGVRLDRQDPEDLIWIREPFLSSTAEHGAVVVHGHTPAKTVVIRPNRIGLDTGAVYGGRLSCAVLWAGRLRLLQA